MKTKIHFEIGTVNDKGETHSVFSSLSLKECINEFEEKHYTLPQYFIDIWETGEKGFPEPIAEIKINSALFE